MDNVQYVAIAVIRVNARQERKTHFPFNPRPEDTRHWRKVPWVFFWNRCLPPQTRVLVADSSPA